MPRITDKQSLSVAPVIRKKEVARTDGFGLSVVQRTPF